jgi:outer membrane protein assembly factor BamB
MMKGLIGTLCLCTSIGVFGDWPTYHGAPDLRGVSDASLVEPLSLAWRYNVGGAVSTTPVSDGERIFFAANKGRVVALDLNGTTIWERSFTRTNDAGQEMALRFEAPLVCADGLVFAGSSRGTLFALDAKTGATQWTYETDGIILGSANMILADRNDAETPEKNKLSAGASARSKIVVMDQSEGMLHCVDAGTGKRIWKTEGVERCDGAPGVGADRIVFGSCLAALHVYDTTGKHLKDIEVGGDGQIAGGVAIEGRLAYAGLRDGALVCVDVEQGEIVWSSEASKEQTFATPAVTAEAVVYTSDDGFVYAVDKKAGTLIWKFDTGGLPYSPVVTKDRVIIAADGLLYVLKLEDGTKLWSKEVSDEITSPALIGGLVVVGADDGTVTAFKGKE